MGPGEVIYDQKQIEAFLSQLPPDERKQMQENLQKLANTVVPQLQQEIYEKIYQKNERETREKQQALVDQKYGQVIGEIFDAVARQYTDNPKVIEFLGALRIYTADKAIEVFMPHTQMTPMGPQEIPFAQVVRQIKTEKGEDPLLPFKVNLFIEGQTDGLPPIIVEANPTYRSMFGWVERLVIFGGETERSATDHTKIHPGAFHKANGGFLVIDLNDILLKPTVLLGLMRTIRTKKIEMHEPSEEIGQTLNGKLLSPEPIGLQLKVVGVINPEYYHDLQGTAFGQELLRHFGLIALFDTTVNVANDNLQSYSRWLDEYASHKGYSPITLEAKAAIIEYLMREAESQKFFSSDLELLKNIVKEAYLYSRDVGAQRIEADHVKRAVSEKIFRLNLAETKLQRAIADGVQIVEVNGLKIGQINGLVVFKTASYMFGIPQRFTVTTYRGEKGLINIAGNVGLAGPVFKKSVETIQGFFYKRYGREQTITFEGRVNAEQISGAIEGDSATMAMLLALISSLSEIPLRQDLAVTDATDQQGNIEAVGGVNQKIEGFFATCKIKGLTGTQGVVIPAANTNHLMLNSEVVEAVEKGQFHIYSVETIDDVVELLMGCPIREIDEYINAKFEQWRKQELEERLKMELEIKEALRKTKKRKRFLIF